MNLLNELSPSVTKKMYLEFYVEALLMVEGKLPEERLMLAHLIAMDYAAKVGHNVDSFTDAEIEEEKARVLDEEQTLEQIYQDKKTYR